MLNLIIFHKLIHNIFPYYIYIYIIYIYIICIGPGKHMETSCLFDVCYNHIHSSSLVPSGGGWRGKTGSTELSSGVNMKGVILWRCLDEIHAWLENCVYIYIIPMKII